MAMTSPQNDVTRMINLASEVTQKDVPSSIGPAMTQKDEPLYVIEGDEEEEDVSAYANPFQASNTMQPVESTSSSATRKASATTPRWPVSGTAKKRPRLSLPLVVGLLCALMLSALAGVRALSAPAQPTGPDTGRGNTSLTPPPHAGPASPKPTVAATGGSAATPPPAGTSDNWLAAQLPFNWAQAGLTRTDAIEVERIALLFSDREMSQDYRDIGTRAHHGGTMTAALALLTPAAQVRFQHNDFRMASNALFDLISSTHLVRQVTNATPQLLQFTIQGQQGFAWVAVSFHLWIAQTDPKTGMRTEGWEMEPGTNQPRVHQLVVLLASQPQAGSQSTTQMLGGTSWLVSNYALDPAAGTLPPIVQPA